jgi:hypothetical protein
LAVISASFARICGVNGGRPGDLVSQCASYQVDGFVAFDRHLAPPREHLRVLSPAVLPRGFERLRDHQNLHVARLRAVAEQQYRQAKGVIVEVVEIEEVCHGV